MKKQDKNCVFCNLHYSDRTKKQIIAENERHTSVTNIAPGSKAHSLIVSKEHYKNVLDGRLRS